MIRHILAWSIVLVFLAGMINAEGQGRRRISTSIPKPPAPAGGADASVIAKPEAQKKHFDAVQAEREARELSELANSISLDVDHLNQGLMPKDVIEKLKRIEKLAKHLRTEVASQ